MSMTVLFALARGCHQCRVQPRCFQQDGMSLSSVALYLRSCCRSQHVKHQVRYLYTDRTKAQGREPAWKVTKAPGRPRGMLAGAGCWSSGTTTSNAKHFKQTRIVDNMQSARANLLPPQRPQLSNYRSSVWQPAPLHPNRASASPPAKPVPESLGDLQLVGFKNSRLALEPLDLS